jgi:hypothetical protein
MPRKKKQATSAANKFRKYYSRKWLNSAAKGGTAFVNAEIEENLDKSDSVYASLEIADCSRIINLDFCIGYGEQTEANAMSSSGLSCLRQPRWLPRFVNEKKLRKRPRRRPRRKNGPLNDSHVDRNRDRRMYRFVLAGSGCGDSAGDRPFLFRVPVWLDWYS